MALDGITLHCLTYELKNKIEKGRIVKITQPEANEIILQIKNHGETYQLFLCASPSLPLIYLSKEKKTNPLQAPLFCMFLRKYIGGGVIEEINQPDLERVIHFRISHQNEMGDKEQLFLTIEIMGKHSNIILYNEEKTILESIRHVSLLHSSVREVLPGRKYFLVSQDTKTSFLDAQSEDIFHILATSSEGIAKTLSNAFIGISFFASNQWITTLGIDPNAYLNTLSENEKLHLSHQLKLLKQRLLDNDFECAIFYKGEEPFEFSVLFDRPYQEYKNVSYQSISHLLETYYISRNRYYLILQKTTNLRKRLQTLLERNKKKKGLQEKQLLDASKRDKYQLYGELLTAYAYQLKPADECEVLNYYNNEIIRIPLKNNLSIMENANSYYERYQKLKRTRQATALQLEETNQEIAHLESIGMNLQLSENDADLELIKKEMINAGYLRKSNAQKEKLKSNEKSKILRYLSHSQLEIFVGKNNIQNEEITFQLARPYDWWFHIKNMPGSHVLLMTKEGQMPDDQSFEQAAALAAYYSSGRNQKRVEVDYTQIKHIKKPPKSPLGMVIYHQNYSMMISPDIHKIEQIPD